MCLCVSQMEIQIRNQTLAEPKRYGEIVVYCNKHMENVNIDLQRLTSKGFSPFDCMWRVCGVRMMSNVLHFWINWLMKRTNPIAAII